MRGMRRGTDHKSYVVLHRETRETHAVVKRVGPGMPLTFPPGAVAGTHLTTAQACAGQSPGWRRDLIIADMAELETHLGMQPG